jgi:hypothetical protein
MFALVVRWIDELRDLLVLAVGYFLRELKWYLLGKSRKTKKRYKPQRGARSKVTTVRPKGRRVAIR